ncbi:hypothetical protein QUF64_13280 [Anaerolineales bacterium HSG6]|nr:hypothetical protein [Anaerolineales bacterium HSG6]
MTTATNNPTDLEMKEALASLWWMPLIRAFDNLVRECPKIIQE